MKADEIVADVTNRIIAQLEKGVLPWVKPWATDPLLEWPMNPTTGNIYTGFNALWLNMASHGFSTNRWLTFKQAQEIGGNVRKGEKGTPALRPIEIKKEFAAAAGEPETQETRVLFRGYTVFNLAQCDGIDHLKPPSLDIPREPIELDPRIDGAVSDTGATIYHDDHSGCYYTPAVDSINMVPADLFHSANDYYATLWHELVHWTGHKDRTDRHATRDNTPSWRAREELVAELGAAFCCQHLKIDGMDSHQSAYIGGWLQVLKEEPGALLKTTRAAATAYRHLLPQPPAP